MSIIFQEHIPFLYVQRKCEGKAATPESGTDFAVASPLRPFHAILLRCVRNAAEKENRGKEEGGRKERATKKKCRRYCYGSSFVPLLLLTSFFCLSRRPSMHEWRKKGWLVFDGTEKKGGRGKLSCSKMLFATLELSLMSSIQRHAKSLPVKVANARILREKKVGEIACGKRERERRKRCFN